MIVRDALLTFAVLVLAIVGGMALVGAAPEWAAVLPALLIITLLFERRRYHRQSSGRPGPGWQMTGEARIDPDTGHVIRIWLDPESGDRREVRIDQTFH